MCASERRFSAKENRCPKSESSHLAKDKRQKFMFEQLYFLIRYAVVAVVMFAVLAMAVRLIFNYVDPNPFTAFGRFAAWVRQQTESFVRPAAQLLRRGGIDARVAPIITILGICVAAYFSLQLVHNVLFTFDGVFKSAASGRVVALVGYILYGTLAVYSLLIIMRIIFGYFLSSINPLQRFLIRATNPILLPFQRFIPPLGVIDISPIIVLFLLNFLQVAVYGVLIASPAGF